MLHFGDYKDTKMIGKGGFSVVYSGTHLDTNLPIAIKSVIKKNLLDKIIFMNFQREIRIIKSLDHPFIIHFYRIMEDDNYIYVVMEDCQNGTLLNQINKRGRLPEVEAQMIFCQILSALRYLHIEREIVHRDLKMENILITGQDTIRLIDFGLSGELFVRAENKCSNPNYNKTQSSSRTQRQRSNSVLLHTQCGSFPYAAPEIFRKHPYNASVDMWSAGVILYAMVTGHLPFIDKNSSRLIQMILHEDPIYPSYLSSELVDLLKNLLNKDIKNRFTVKQASEHPWILHSSYNFLASESFISQRQFRIFPQSAGDINKDITDRICQLDVPVEGFETEIDELITKFHDSSIRYFKVITSQNDNLLLSSSVDVIGIDSNQSQTQNDFERDRFDPNTLIKLSTNARESQAFQYYRMLKNKKISDLISIQLKNSMPNQLRSPSFGKLPSLKSASSSPQKSIPNNTDTENSVPTPTLNMRPGSIRRPVAQLDLILLRKRQTGSRASRASMPIINHNK